MKVVYKDGASWLIRINEISEIRHTIGYEVLSTEPAHTATSIQGLIILRAVTSCDSTFIEWQTDFSNDADAQVIADQKYKKLEFFTELAHAIKGASGTTGEKKCC